MRLGKGRWSRAKVQSKRIQLLAPFQEQEMEEALDSTRTVLSRWARNHGAQYSLQTDYWLFLKSAFHWVPWIRLSSSLSSSSLISCRRTSSPWLALGRHRPANWAEQLPGNSKQALRLGRTFLLTIPSALVLLRPETEPGLGGGSRGDWLLFPNLLWNIALIISLSSARFLSHLPLSVQIVISHSGPPLPLLPPPDTRKIQMRVWPQFHCECNSWTQNNPQKCPFEITGSWGVKQNCQQLMKCSLCHIRLLYPQ